MIQGRSMGPARQRLWDVAPNSLHLMLLDAIAQPAWSNATLSWGLHWKRKNKKQRSFQNRLDFIGVRVCGRISPLTALPASSAECKSIGPASGRQKVTGGKWFPLSRSCSAPEHLSVGITIEERSGWATSFGGTSALSRHRRLDAFWEEFIHCEEEEEEDKEEELKKEEEEEKEERSLRRW